MDKLTYGNGDFVQYTYDDYGRVIQETFEDGSTVTYAYDNSGALATVTDSETGIKTTYYYDFTDRLMKYVESGTNYSHSVGYEYDTLNNLTLLVETINGVEHTTSYTYDADNRVTSVTTDGITYAIEYDTFGRVKQAANTTGGITRQYFYFENSVQTNGVWVSAPQYTADLYYSYDDNGNIVVEFDAENGHLTNYTYDSANQLIQEENTKIGKKWIYAYDDAGNILSRTESVYPAGDSEAPVDTVYYTYGDANWGDLLTAYDGNTITYDGIGNPLSDGTWNYTWKQGRQLATMSDGTTTWTYTYDANGMRTGRTNGTTTYSYVYNGSQLVQMTVGNDTLYFSYDAYGHPMSLTYNGTVYYYIVNVPGDVIAILDENGSAVVEYVYDAWGNIHSITGSMASTLGTLNPLTYRGYVYDTETDLYYLQSRYYNPEWGRFLNADSYISTGQGLLGSNMFAYCENNPVRYVDSDGYYPVIPIHAGLNLPSDGGIPVDINGVTYYYSLRYNGRGELYEYWHDADGNIVWGRHHSDHRQPKYHKNPHDHEGTKDKDGNNTINKKPEEVNNNFHAPNKETVHTPSNNDAIGYTVAGVVIGVALYQATKWTIATLLAPASGGSSFAIVALIP